MNAGGLSMIFPGKELWLGHMVFLLGKILYFPGCLP